MTHYPQPHPTHRAKRVKLTSTPVVVKLGDGKQAKGHLQVVSVNGGRYPRETSSRWYFKRKLAVCKEWPKCCIRSVGQGSIFQGFRFVAMGDEAHQSLNMALESAGDSVFFQ